MATHSTTTYLHYSVSRNYDFDEGLLFIHAATDFGRIPAGRYYRCPPLTNASGSALTIPQHDIVIPYYGIGVAMATLYGALAMLPLGWATAGYVLVSRAPTARPKKGTPR
jgi:hypothetical protein